MNKTDILSLYEKTLEKIRTNAPAYLDFLELASRLPKYTFQNEVLIYAQNPQALACASQSVWENTMRHKMNRVVSPIHIIGADDEPEIIFDISDVEVIPNVSRQLPTWNVNSAHRKEYFDSLIKEFPLADNAYELSDSFENDIEQFAFSVVVEKISENATDFDEVKYLSLIATAGITKVVTSACDMQMRNSLTVDHLKLTDLDRNTAESIGELINETSMDMLSVIRAKSKELEISPPVFDTSPTPQLNTEKESSFEEKTNQNELSFFIGDNSEDIEKAIDSILRLGGKEKHSSKMIAIFFRKDYDISKNTEFLINQYGNIGHGINMNGVQYSAWFDNKGATFAEGVTATESADKVFLTWEQVEGRINTLLANGEYLTASELEQLDELEVDKLSQEVAYLLQDVNNREIYFGDNYSSWLYGAVMEGIKKNFYDVEGFEQLTSQLENLSIAVDNDPTIMRLRFYKPAKVLEHVKGFLDTKVSYHSNMLAFPPVGLFITEDEINNALKYGSNYSESKTTIYGGLTTEKLKKNQISFLKEHHGIGGSTHSLGGKQSSWSSQDGKGIHLSIGTIFEPIDEVLLSWANVTDRINTLIKNGEYLSPDELELFEKNRDKYLPVQKTEIIFDDEIAEPETIKKMVVEVQNSQLSFFDETFQLERINETIIKEKSSRPRTVEPELELSDEVEVEPTPIEIPKKVIESDITTETIIGKTVILDDREFVVERISIMGNVSLRDETFKRQKGFPIFRSEKLELIEYALDQQAIQEQQTVTNNQKTEEKAGKHVSANPPQELVVENELLAHDDIIEVSDKKEIDYSAIKNFSLSESHFADRNNRQKVTHNLEALELLNELERDARAASEDEQEKLAGFIGWGGLPEVFDEREGKNSLYAAERERLKNLLSESEYEEAKASTLTAHYTPKVIIDTIYKALDNFGFEGGNIIDPALGSGNFFGCMPEDMKKSSVLYGVEIDTTTSSLAKNLYPEANIINAGFEKTSFPDNFFDVAIGNVPFGNYSVNDTRYNRHKP